MESQLWATPSPNLLPSSGPWPSTVHLRAALKDREQPGQKHTYLPELSLGLSHLYTGTSFPYLYSPRAPLGMPLLHGQLLEGGLHTQLISGSPVPKAVTGLE